MLQDSALLLTKEDIKVLQIALDRYIFSYIVGAIGYLIGYLTPVDLVPYILGFCIISLIIAFFIWFYKN